MASRREVLAAGGALVALALVRPAAATPQRMQEAIAEHLGEAGPARQGRVRIEVPPLVENGNTVPLSITVDSPMTEADHVRSIALFTERNPLPQVIAARLGPKAGAARLETRIRLATSQKLVALAVMSDGSVWTDSAEVVVTLAACVEG
jgi:sulfur-oxidizing protein SoxY